jgi:hypothetical protein
VRCEVRRGEEKGGCGGKRWLYRYRERAGQGKGRRGKSLFDDMST